MKHQSLYIFFVSALSCLLFFSFSPSQTFAKEQQANSATITLGQIDLSFYSVVGGVVHEILAREGYEVVVVEGPHADIFPQLGGGKVDIFVAAWLPNGHAQLFAKVENSTFKITKLYDGASFFWAVPSYVPENVLASIDDLKKPQVVENIAKQIISLPATTGLTVGGKRVMQTYKLDQAGYSLVASSPAHWLETLENAYKEEQWIVVPLWQPVWVNAAFNLRPLKEPKNVYGVPDAAYLLGHKELRNKLSNDTLAILSNIQLTVDAVTEMDLLVKVEGLSPRDAARRWMSENRNSVESWYSD